MTRQPWKSSESNLWISLVHFAFFGAYIQNNPGMMEGYERLPVFVSPRLMVLIVGPFIGAASGVVAGLLAMIAAKLMKKGEARG